MELKGRMNLAVLPDHPGLQWPKTNKIKNQRIYSSSHSQLYLLFVITYVHQHSSNDNVTKNRMHP